MNSLSECKTTAVAYFLAVVGAFLIVAGLVWVMISYTRPEPIDQDRASVRLKTLTEVRNADAEVLYASGFVWEDQAKGIVRLPITNAMELSLRLWQDKAAARSNLVGRVEKKYYVPPPPPNKFD